MNNDGYTLHMERIFNAPQQTVFDYLTVPKLMKDWFGPGGTTTENAEIDLQIGGTCRWHIRTPSGLLTYLYGTIVELDPPKRVVMTHKWHGAEDETTVTFELIDMENKTRLLLTQTGISEQKLIDLLNQGWAGPLEQLAELFSRQLV